MANTLDKIRLSGVTYDIIDSTAIHSMDGYWTSGQTESAITAATGALAETIAEQHYQTSGDVQNAISGKANSADVITEVGIKTLNDTGYKVVQLTQKKGGVAQSDKNVIAFDTATLSATTYDNTYSIKVRTDVFAKKTDIPSVSGYADAVAYDSNTKYMKFYNGGTGGTMVYEFDASPFLIDGMVQNVEIKDVTISGESVTCLVISFNTDAGKQDINIPLTEIFDASNYYTTAQTDSAIEAATSGKADSSAVTEEISAAVSGKADTTAVTAVNNVLTAHTADTTIHVTSSDKTTWSGKQDALVSGTNIKTVGGNSLLGSGDIAFPAGMTAEVSGTTLIFS